MNGTTGPCFDALLGHGEYTKVIVPALDVTEPRNHPSPIGFTPILIPAAQVVFLVVVEGTISPEGFCCVMEFSLVTNEVELMVGSGPRSAILRNCQAVALVIEGTQPQRIDNSSQGRHSKIGLVR